MRERLKWTGETAWSAIKTDQQIHYSTNVSALDLKQLSTDGIGPLV